MIEQETPEAVQMPLPKPRGRPRASFAHTGEFDLGLIREYRARPALYDRTSKRYKDKVYVAQLWQIISHKLGYDVSILRDRIVQLRNRYNIEKRRIDVLNNDNPGNSATSQWPLYESMNFLSEHIRTRRSFKASGKLVDGQNEEHYEPEVDESGSDNPEGGPIKLELQSNVGTGDVPTTDEEADHEEDIIGEDGEAHMPVATVLHVPCTAREAAAAVVANHQIQTNGNVNGQVSHSNAASVGVRQYGLRQRAVQQQHTEKLPELIVAAPKRTHLVRSGSNTKRPRIEGPVQQTELHTTSLVANSMEKYRAFGEFVQHSLADLPNSVALRLVEKFTSELVEASLKAVRAHRTVSNEND